MEARFICNGAECGPESMYSCPGVIADLVQGIEHGVFREMLVVIPYAGENQSTGQSGQGVLLFAPSSYPR